MTLTNEQIESLIANYAQDQAHDEWMTEMMNTMASDNVPLPIEVEEPSTPVCEPPRPAMEVNTASTSGLNWNALYIGPSGHNTDMGVIMGVLANPYAYTNGDLMNVNQVYYDSERRDHKYYYMAAHTMKVLKSIAIEYGLSLPDLYSKFGNNQMMRCQCGSVKGGQCKKPAIYGQYYCESHIATTSFVTGMADMLRRSNGCNGY